jgi:transposase
LLGKRARPVLRGRQCSNALPLPDWKPWFFLLEASGLQVWLVNARDVKNVPGRPKTDKLDAIWLAKLTERGMLRASFVPPKPIRQLRDLTRTRTVFTDERSRHKQRVEKILEDAQIKLSTVATDIFGVSGRAMMDALIAGERNPKVLAEMARAGMRKKREALVEALTGNFEDHHAHLIALVLKTIDHLTAQIEELSTAIERALSDLPTPDGPGGGSGSAMGLIGHLDEIPGIGPATAQVILAEVGLDMSVFPTPDHLVSWAKLCPRTIQSGNKNTSGKTGKGNSWLKRALGEAAMAAAKTDTFLGARYRRDPGGHSLKGCCEGFGFGMIVVRPVPVCPRRQEGWGRVCRWSRSRGRSRRPRWRGRYGRSTTGARSLCQWRSATSSGSCSPMPSSPPRSARADPGAGPRDGSRW